MNAELASYLPPLIAGLSGYFLKHYFPNLVPWPAGPKAPAPPGPSLDHPFLLQLEQMLAAAARQALKDWFATANFQQQAKP